MTLTSLAEFVGPRGHVKLSYSRPDGWTLLVVTSDGDAWSTKTQDSDLEALFDRCVEALKAQANLGS
jgi:hypothetical protein